MARLVFVLADADVEQGKALARSLFSDLAIDFFVPIGRVEPTGTQTEQITFSIVFLLSMCTVSSAIDARAVRYLLRGRIPYTVAVLDEFDPSNVIMEWGLEPERIFRLTRKGTTDQEEESAFREWVRGAAEEFDGADLSYSYPDTQGDPKTLREGEVARSAITEGWPSSGEASLWWLIEERQRARRWSWEAGTRHIDADGFEVRRAQPTPGGTGEGSHQPSERGPEGLVGDGGPELEPPPGSPTRPPMFKIRRAAPTGGMTKPPASADSGFARHGSSELEPIEMNPKGGRRRLLLSSLFLAALGGGLLVWLFLPRGDHPNFKAVTGARTPHTSPAVRKKASSNQSRLTDFSAFSPMRADRGDSVLVQVLLHDPNDERVLNVARRSDPLAEPRSSKTLLLPLAMGDRVAIRIVVPSGCEADDPVETLVWSGKPAAAGFRVTISQAFVGRVLPVTIQAFKEGEPIGKLAFNISVSPGEQTRPKMVGDEARQYHRIFVSYASEDRPTVVRYTHAWAVLKQPVFQDFLSLDPGDRWEKRLFEEIQRSDLFLLFWSAAAKRSEYVQRETEYAIQLRERGCNIDIVPVLIEGPPPPEPPSSLASLHFNDKYAYIVNAVMSEGAARALQ